MSDWNFACADWEARLREGRSLLPDLPLNWRDANKAVSIYDKLHLPDVPGTPVLREAGGEWARDIIRGTFGSLDKEGVRHVAQVFCMVPKKNSKTTNGAAIMLTAMLMNKRPRAEFVLVGPTQEVAELAYNQASGMIECDPDGYLQKRFHVQDHLKTIKDRLNKSRLKVKTFDMKVATGSKPVGLLIDELHLMATISGADRVIGQLRGGMLANPEAFMIYITTQSDQPPAGIFKTELEYARGIRDERITRNVRMLPLIYEFPEAMQVDDAKPWMDPDNWHMVLPNLGKSITLPRLIEDFDEANDKGEEELRRWASQHLNVQIGLALHSGGWAGARHWEKQEDETLTLDSLLERSDVVVAGVDGGGLDDLLALALMGRDKETGDWLLWVHAWGQKDIFRPERAEIHQRLQDFIDLGQLTLCEDPTQDIRELADYIERVHKAKLFPKEQAVGLDPQSVGAIVAELLSRKLDEKQVIGVTQGYQLSSAVWSCERKLKDGTLWHGGQELLTWCVGNAKVEQRGNAVVVTKQAAGKSKIDPLVAAFDAAKLMERNPQPVKREYSIAIF